MKNWACFLKQEWRRFCVAFSVNDNNMCYVYMSFIVVPPLHAYINTCDLNDANVWRRRWWWRWTTFKSLNNINIRDMGFYMFLFSLLVAQRQTLFAFFTNSWNIFIGLLFVGQRSE